MLAHYKAEPLLKEELFLRQLALSQQRCDPRSFAWNSRPALSEERTALAWQLASYSAYSEQVGMLIAARLLGEVEDTNTKFALASAVSDEARHSETFRRYATVVGGDLAATVPAQIVALHRGLVQEADTNVCMVAHTILEGWAFDEFRCLQRVFRGDLLETIYRAIRSDEGRHVAIGLSATRAYFLRHAASAGEDGSYSDVIRRGEALATEVSGFNDDSLAHLASLVGRPVVGLREWFAARHESRLQRMQPDAGSGI